ncbi:MAG: restriction endonuclease subunit S [Anaerolineaceae bacterium]|nr:restriction endonuclease subunit S [Anaerolineaceae bacterium]MCY4022193.1 restriction endonuclease subunit S [Anaerolineaceae bacterium]
MARITPCLENGKIAQFVQDANRLTSPAHGSTEFIVIRGRNGLSDTSFAYYLTKWDELRDYAISQMSGTSGRQRVPVDCFDHFIVSLPKLSEQRAIAHILGTLDDKIELNRRMNETLEAMAQVLFKSWFVDFDPVRAKMEGRDTGLPPHIADLFPDRLVPSELGEIPAGWDTYSLDELATHHSKTLAPSSSPESEFEHYSIPAFDTGFSPAIELGSAIKSNKTIVPDNAILLSKLNPEIPRVWIPEHRDSRKQICSTEFLVFTPAGPGQLSLLFSLFTDESFRALLQSMVTGTSKSHQRVPVRALKKCVVLSGTSELFSLFDRLVSPNLRSVLENRVMSRTLADLRDALLPKLMSGEVKV